MDHRLFDQAAEIVGGHFKLSVLVQRRLREIVRGGQPLVPVEPGMGSVEIAIKEIVEGKLRYADMDIGIEDVDVLGLRKQSKSED
ncbi:MAG: DNA-directed RNA polymerase subunit omega [Planctomycetota bacterium]|jgi:DNA-directed RNA polymerase subunit K/omega